MSKLSSKNWVVRSQAIKALGAVSTPSIIPELKMRIALDEVYMVKLYSAQVLFSFGNKGKKELESLLESNQGGEIENIIKYVLYETESY